MTLGLHPFGRCKGEYGTGQRKSTLEIQLAFQLKSIQPTTGEDHQKGLTCIILLIASRRVLVCSLVNWYILGA
jgi:hypothetical protein